MERAAARAEVEAAADKARQAYMVRCGQCGAGVNASPSTPTLARCFVRSFVPAHACTIMCRDMLCCCATRSSMWWHGGTYQAAFLAPTEGFSALTFSFPRAGGAPSSASPPSAGAAAGPVRTPPPSGGSPGPVAFGVRDAGDAVDSPVRGRLRPGTALARQPRDSLGTAPPHASSRPRTAGSSTGRAGYGATLLSEAVWCSAPRPRWPMISPSRPAR